MKRLAVLVFFDLANFSVAPKIGKGDTSQLLMEFTIIITRIRTIIESRSYADVVSLSASLNIETGAEAFSLGTI